ncbi:MAG: hypothetical protein H0W50_06120 [Parachlamydiaceae bacterium]|nr:hypothetical protein [Parachlamydiaceae bacterium]
MNELGPRFFLKGLQKCLFARYEPQKLEVEVERLDEVMFKVKVMGLILCRFGCRKT